MCGAYGRAQAEFEELRPRVKYWDVERVIDDFVMICFFVGNDFLPHLPSLDIREGALDMLIGMYKRLLPELAGYLTRDGEIDMAAAARMLGQVGSVEQRIFEARRDEANFSKRRAEDQKNRMTGHGAGGPPWMQQQGRGGPAAGASAAWAQQQLQQQQQLIQQQQQQQMLVLQQQQQLAQRVRDMRAQEARLAEFARAGGGGRGPPAPAPGSATEQNKIAAASLRAMMRASDSVAGPSAGGAARPGGPSGAEVGESEQVPRSRAPVEAAPAPAPVPPPPISYVASAAPIAMDMSEPTPASSDPLVHHGGGGGGGGGDAPPRGCDEPPSLPESRAPEADGGEEEEKEDLSAAEMALRQEAADELKVAVRVKLSDKHADQGKAVVDSVRLGDDGCAAGGSMRARGIQRCACVTWRVPQVEGALLSRKVWRGERVQP